MLAMLISPGESLDGSCQIANMAALLKSLFFLFNISFLPKYRVNYCDYRAVYCIVVEFGSNKHWRRRPGFSEVLGVFFAYKKNC